MSDLNWWMLLAAFACGVGFTLLWSLRRVTRRIEVEPVLPGATVASEPAPELATELVGASVGLAASTDHHIAGGSDEPPAPPLQADHAGPAPVAEPAACAPSETDANREVALSPAEPVVTPEVADDSGCDAAAPVPESVKPSALRPSPAESSLVAAVRSAFSARSAASSASAIDLEGVSWWDRSFVRHRPDPAKTLAEVRAARAAREAAEAAAAASPRPVSAAPSPSPVSAATPILHRGASRRPVKPAKASRRSRSSASAPDTAIKGNRGSMLYHTVDSPYYRRTKAEQWFATEAEAEAAGYRRWDTNRKPKDAQRRGA